MGSPLGPNYIPYTYMDPLGLVPQQPNAEELAVDTHGLAYEAQLLGAH